MGRANLFPSPLWGGARGGGRTELRRRFLLRTPLPTLPHKGGGNSTRIRRRTFLTLLGGAATAFAPRAARAQQGAMPVIGVLEPGSDAVITPRQDILLQTLKDQGFIEGRNFVFDTRKADGHLDRLPELARELVGRQPALIVVGSPPATRAAMAATSTIPILFGMGEDPVKEGVVTSLNRPGGNVTGIVNFGNQLVAKRVQLLRELVPSASDFGFLVNPDNPNAEPDANDALAAAASLNITLRLFKASNDAELANTFEAAAAQRLGALLVGVDNILFRPRRQLIVAVASRYAVPTIYEERDFVEAGGLMSYGSDFADTARQAAAYIARILKGAKPGDLPVQQASKFELIVNLNAAKAIKLDVPTSILLLADEVIE
jgi:putative tryptophan/tyrosine transport system substrate-binding protein